MTTGTCTYTVHVHVHDYIHIHVHVHVHIHDYMYMYIVILFCRFLQQNLIKKIDNISHLVHLDTLNLSNNQITHLDNLSMSRLVQNGLFNCYSSGYFNTVWFLCNIIICLSVRVVYTIIILNLYYIHVLVASGLYM